MQITIHKSTKLRIASFCWWLFDVLNLVPTDELTDLFPGTGVMSREWERFKRFEDAKMENTLFA